MAISCCTKCAKTFEEGMDGDWPPICPPCYRAASYPPCKRCNGPNDLGELCVNCAEATAGFDYEAAGAWMAQR